LWISSGRSTSAIYSEHGIELDHQRLNEDTTALAKGLTSRLMLLVMTPRQSNSESIRSRAKI
jgi:hypothetical protein